MSDCLRVGAPSDLGRIYVYDVEWRCPLRLLFSSHSGLHAFAHCIARLDSFGLHLLPVAPGVEFKLRLVDGMTGFLLAAPTSGCRGDEELSLPPFTLDLEVLSRPGETSLSSRG